MDGKKKKEKEKQNKTKELYWLVIDRDCWDYCNLALEGPTSLSEQYTSLSCPYIYQPTPDQTDHSTEGNIR